MASLIDGPNTQRERRVFYLLLLAAAVLLITLLYRLSYQRPIELSAPPPNSQFAETTASNGVGKTLPGFDDGLRVGSGEVPVSSATESTQAANASAAPPLLAYITGAVVQPGVYPFQSGARWVDAVEAAGGANEGADLTYINLARTVQDGERIYVPRKGEAIEAGSLDAETGVSGEGTPLRLDPNHATAAALERLPGVGPVLAQRMIDERSRAPFRSLGDLQRVPGIGVKSVERLAPYISLPR